MVIAEAPGREEDAAYAREVKLAEQEGRGPLGTQLIGNAGKRVAKELMRYNIDLYEDCWLINAVNCRPPKNRTPTTQEITACRPRVLKAIEELKPRFILVLGNVGVESLLAHRWYDGEGGLGGIGRWRGWQAPDQDLGAWVCPTFHPSYVLRCESGNDPQVPLYFSLDIERFAELVDHPKPWPEPPQEEQVKIRTERRAARLLTDLLKGSGAVTIDYETTGLKPNAPGHQIVCVGIGWGDDNAAAFQMTPRLEPLMARFLRSKRGKIAQNLQFEERWSRVCLGTSVNGWCWDTMLAAHCLDNRGHISGLKFQSYVQLGITDYSSEISPFLKANSSLGMNRVLEAPREKLLRYCGMDALCTARIADIQSRRFEAGDAPWDGIQLLLEGAMILADDEENGVVVDRAYIRQQKEHFKKRIAAILRRIEQSPEGKLWQKKYGEKTNFNSNPQLAAVLFQELGLNSVRTTAGGKPSVNEETLEELADEVPLVRDIAEMRKLEKISGTYLTGWEREISADGIMRPFYHLATARTFRSSSSSPNLQNVPIRDQTAQRACRRAVYPRAGHRLVEVDYSGIEVRVSACVHKDPQMIIYITDKSTDMHRDTAMECYKLELDEVSKGARQGAKNQFVFPEFYGSFWKNTGPGLWKWAQDCETAKGEPLMKHLKKHGLGTAERFVKHIREVEDRFWNERFRVYNQWKEKFWKQYLRNGYFETLTGFRCQGPMRKNEVVNYPIQGPAFHCLLKAKALTKQWIAEQRLGQDVLPCGQVHDSGMFSTAPDVFEEVAVNVHRIWCEELRKVWDWIIVPLEIEIDVTPVDGNWFQKKEYKLEG
jgi:uracil-DNA glycosylase family 4